MWKESHGFDEVRDYKKYCTYHSNASRLGDLQYGVCASLGLF